MLRARHETGTDFRLAVALTILFFGGLLAGILHGSLFAAAVGSSLGLLAGSVLAVWKGIAVTRRDTSAAPDKAALVTPSDGLPAVSVVIACFNAERTIVETVRSAASQSVKRIEIIVVDDGSSDTSRDLVAALASNDSRIRLVAQPNSGPSIARNHGVRLARAAVVAFLDSDDLWDADHLALNLAALEADQQLGVSFGGARFMSEEGSPTGRRTRLWTNGVSSRDVLASNPTTTCSSLVVRKDVFSDAGEFRNDMKYAEDQEWLFRVLAKGWRVRSVSMHSIQYRTSYGGLSCQVEKMRMGWQHFIERARELDPQLVQRHLPRATANMELYFADRNMASQGKIGPAARCVWRAVRSWPPIAITAPKRFLGTVIHVAAHALSSHHMLRSASS